MDNRLKRFLSLALAIMMVIGLMPANVVFATENEGEPVVVADEPHVCNFEDVVTTPATYDTRGVVTPTCSCGEKQATKEICATGCMIKDKDHSTCKIKCDKKTECTLEKGHTDVCMNGDTVLVDISNVFSEKGLRAAIGAGGEIKLTEDIVLHGALTIDSTVTLNLNGKSVTAVAAKEGEDAPAYALINNGTLTIKGAGTVGGVHNNEGKTLTIENGTFTATGSDTYAVRNAGTAVINGGNFQADGGEYAVRNEGAKQMTIKGAAVDGVYNASGILRIISGTFNGNAGAHAVYSLGGSLAIEGGEFHNNTANVATVKVKDTCSATITGGTITNEADAPALAVETTDEYGVTISGGAVIKSGIAVADGAELTVDGGSFQDPDNNSFSAGETAEITVNGGTYEDANAQNFAKLYAQDNKILIFKEGTQEVKKVKSAPGEVSNVVATIGSGDAIAGYATLEAAIAVGGTIDLIADTTVSETIEVSKSVILNLGNHTITSTVDAGRIFKLMNGCASFKLNGGKFVSNSETDYGVVDIKTAAEVVVDGSEFDFDTDDGAIFKGRDTGNSFATLKLKDVKVDTNYQIVNNGGENDGALNSMTIEGGEFKTKNAAFIVNVIESVSFKDAVVEAASLGIEIAGCGNTQATATFTNNTVTVTGGGTVGGGMNDYVIGFSDGIDVTIVSGTYGNSGYTGNLLGLTTSGDNLVIQGGTFNGKITTLCATGKVSITGGTFNNFAVASENGGKLVISGGNFDADPSDWMAMYYEAIRGTDNRYTVRRKDVDGQRPDTSDRTPFGSFLVTEEEAKNIIDEIVDAINNSAADVPADVTLVIKPTAIEAERDDDDNIRIFKLTYDVTPMRGNEAVHKLSKAVTFRLPIPSDINSYITKAYVTHDGKSVLHTIKGDATTGKYIELSASEFSSYEVELIDIDYSNHVAKIGIKGYASVQAAINAVKEGETIELMELPQGKVYGPAAIDLSQNKSFTIDGAAENASKPNRVWYYDGTGATITVTGSNSVGKKVTIKNIAFDRVNKTSGEFIKISGNGVSTNNVEILDCTFTGAGGEAPEMTAINLYKTNGVVIDGGSASDLYAFLVNVGGKNLTVKNITVDDSTVGLELGAIQGVTVEGVTITGTTGKYGISMDGSVNNAAKFKDCIINAYLPVMVYNTTANGTIEFNGTNTMNGSVTGGHWMVLADAKYSTLAEGTNPKKLSTTGRIIITVNDTGLKAKADGINYKHADEENNKYYTVAPEGKLESAVVMDVSASHISLDIQGLKANERVEAEIYDAAGTKIAHTKLVNKDVIYNATLTGIVEIAYQSGSWETTWLTAEKCPTYKNVPAKAKLYVDGALKGEVPVYMEQPVIPVSKMRPWTDVEGVGNLTVTTGGKTIWKHSLAEAFAAVPAKGKGTVTLFEDNDAVLFAAGEVTGGKTITVTGKATFDWGKDWLFIGRGANSGNGTLIFDGAVIKACDSKVGDGAIGFHVSGEQEGAANKNNGNLQIVGGSSVEVDWIVNRNYVLVDEGSTLNVKYGLYNHGRPASETPNGKDATAVIDVMGGSVLKIQKTAVAAVLGEEGQGELNVNGATFICNVPLTITEKEGTDLNVSGTSTLNIKKITGKAVKLLAEATIKNSTIGGNAIVQGTEGKPVGVTFSGKNTVGILDLAYGEVYIDTDSLLTAKNINVEADVNKIIIDASKLGTKTVKVIDLTDGSKAVMSSMVSVKNNAAAKQIGADGDVSVYFEAYIDRDKNNKFTAGEGYASVEQAVAAAKDNETVVLLTDAHVESAIEINKKIVLNLNAKEIVSDAKNISAVKVKASGVTIKNGKITAAMSGNTGIEVAKDAAVEVTGAEVVGKVNGIKAYGKVTVGKGANITAQGSSAAICAYDNAAVTVDGGTVSSNGCAIELNKAAALTVNSGEVNGAPAVQIYGGTMTVNGGKVIGKSTNAIVTCSDGGVESNIAETAVVINDGNVKGAIVAKDDEDGVVPKKYKVSVTIKGGKFTNSKLDEDFVDEDYASIAVSGGIFDKWVPIEMCADNYICREKAGTKLFEVVYYEHTRIFLEDAANSNLFAVGGEAYVDGEAYEIQPGKVILLDKAMSKKAAMFITTYTYNAGKSKGAEDDYPEKMYVWYAVGKKSANSSVYTSYEVERVAALDNFFQYNGTSIRVGGSDNGIRFFSSVNEKDANKLMNGKLITGKHPLAGAEMTKVGTEFWKSADKKLRSEVYGGAVGNSFRVFQKYSGRNWFTGVLVGLGKDKETTVASIYSRPYAEIKVGKNTVTLYGGILDRSIYYVATQNKDVFPAGSSHDKFVEGLIAQGKSASGKNS